MKVDPYLVGILLGDGSLQKRKDGAYAVWIDQAEKNKQIIEKEVIPRLRLRFNVHAYRYYAKADKTYKHRALVYSKELYQELKRKFGDITTYIEGLSDEDARRFIAGIMDAEGTVTDRIVIYNKNRKLLEAIQQKLTRMRIEDSHIYKFGVVDGLQIYKRGSLRKFVKEIPSFKLRSRKLNRL